MQWIFAMCSSDISEALIILPAEDNMPKCLSWRKIDKAQFVFAICLFDPDPLPWTPETYIWIICNQFNYGKLLTGMYTPISGGYKDWSFACKTAKFNKIDDLMRNFLQPGLWLKGVCYFILGKRVSNLLTELMQCL